MIFKDIFLVHESTLVQTTWSKILQSYLLDMLVLALFLILFYMYSLGHYPLFIPDEGRYSEAAREMILTGNYITPHVNNVVFLEKPIFHFWLQAIALHFFGVNEWAVRFFPSLIGVLGCLITYLCGRYLFDRQTAIIASVILATSPLYFGAAHYANLDLEVAVFVSSSLLFFITAVKGYHRSLFLFLSYGCAALAFLTKGLIAIAFPILVIGIWILLLNRWNILKKIHAIKGTILFLIIILPWLILAQQSNPAFFHYFIVVHQITRFLSVGVFNNPMPIWFYVPVVIIGLFPWTVVLFQSARSAASNIYHRANNYETELFLLIWPSVIILFFSIPHSKMIGYILPVFPPLALLIAHYLALQINNKNNSRIVLLLMCANFLLAIIIFILTYIKPIIFSPQFKIYSNAMVLTLCISSILLFFAKKNMKAIFVSCILTNIFLLIILMHGASFLNTHSTKPLVQVLKKYLIPQDEVVNYFKFYQDVPFYLQRYVTIVADWHDQNILFHDNWKRELWSGIAFQNNREQLIDEDTFWQRYDGNKRLFIFLNENDFAGFKSKAKQYFFIKKNNHVILLSNQSMIKQEKPLLSKTIKREIN